MEARYLMEAEAARCQALEPLFEDRVGRFGDHARDIASGAREAFGGTVRHRITGKGDNGGLP